MCSSIARTNPSARGGQPRVSQVEEERASPRGSRGGVLVSCPGRAGKGGKHEWSGWTTCMVCRASLAAAISRPAPGNKRGAVVARPPPDIVGSVTRATGVEVADETERILAAAGWNGLENRYGLPVHRGFESPPLR